MSAYAAVATDNGHVFFGGQPLDDDFVPSFMSSSKTSGKRIAHLTLSGCLWKYLQRNRSRDFSVNDCPRKIRAKNEKRRDRKNTQNYKDSVCAS